MGTTQLHYVLVASAQDWHALDWFGALSRGHYFASTLFLSDKPADLLGMRKRQIHSRLVVSPVAKRQHEPSSLKKSLVGRGFVAVLIRMVNLLRLLRLVSSTAKSRKPTLFHAYSVSYALVCAIAGVKFIAMPQGSDLLVRPEKSLLARVLTRYAISRAWTVAVASPSLRIRAESFGARRLMEVQNGISLHDTSLARETSRERHRITSIRAVKKTYQIIEILEQRKKFLESLCMTFTYPEVDSSYFDSAKRLLTPCDEVLGTLAEKNELFRVYSESLVCVSIPTTDASPRSVYEAIFCGAVILASDCSWIGNLPDSMLQRVIIVNTNEPDWLKKGIEEARIISLGSDFEPCEAAISRFTEDGATKQFVLECGLSIISESDLEYAGWTA